MTKENELNTLKRHCELIKKQETLNNSLNRELKDEHSYIKSKYKEPCSEDIFPALEKDFTSALIKLLLFIILTVGVVLLAMAMKNSGIVIIQDCWLALIVLGGLTTVSCAIWKLSSCISIRTEKANYKLQWDEYQANVVKAKVEYPKKKTAALTEKNEIEEELERTIETVNKVEKIFNDAYTSMDLNRVIKKMEDEDMPLVKATKEVVEEILEAERAEREYRREYALCLRCRKFNNYCPMAPKDECAAYWPK